MNLLNKLFGTKNPQIPKSTKTFVGIESNQDAKPVVSESIIFSDKTIVSYLNMELSSVSRITGLDDEFINLIYFLNDQEKQKHCDNINSILSKLKIKSGADFLKVQDKIIDYNIDSDEPIPFLIESLLIENFDVTKDSNGKTEMKSTGVTKGIEKTQDYYSAANFISENICLKLNSQQTDFSFEENLFKTEVLKADLNNFAKLNSVFSLGHAFFKSGNITKAEHYFDLLEKGPFDLQPYTIAGFYRNIGELYADIDNKNKAIKWLNAGLTLNPKLGVKKLITKLKADK